MAKKTKKDKVKKGKTIATTKANPKAAVDRPEIKQGWSMRKPIAATALRFFLLLLIVGSVIRFLDSKGYFNPDNRNNHTLRKWDSYYEFTEKNPVDVLLVGNSHVYTGVNPKNLSAALGATAFILGAPGTNVVDHYYALEEAIKVNKPSLVVMETYGLKPVKQKEIRKGALSDQFQSFAARKDFWLKLKSTSSLFTVGNYPYAWSNTLRNHNFFLFSLMFSSIRS